MLPPARSSSVRMIRQLATTTRSFASSSSHKASLNHAIAMVNQYDPVGNIPGRLLPEKAMTETYYAVRSFWVETGLRFGTTTRVSPHSTPEVHLQWWTEGIENIYDAADLPSDFDHPTLHLLQGLVQQHDLRKHHFDDILNGRRKDLDIKQYETLDELSLHAQASCGSLAKLVLEGGHVSQEKLPEAYEAARLVGVCHGLTNALRLSIPIVSTTGKLIVPQDLCDKYNVRSPRYLLSALGQGDAECRRAFHSAIQDIVEEARSNLAQARELRSSILAKQDGDKAVAVLIPGVASEVFLDRLQQKNYDLTDKNLRSVGIVEQGSCVAKMIVAYYQKTY